MPRRSRLRTAGLVLLVLIVAALALACGDLVTRDLHSRAAPTVAPSPTPTVTVRTPAVIASATAAPPGPRAPSSPPAAAPAAVRARISAALRAPALGGRLLAEVVDADTGTVLYAGGSSTPSAPASTAKLLTAAALLSVRRPTDRITTTLRNAGGGTLVLVGGGDPTLTGAAAGKPGAYPGAARLTTLAAAVRAAHLTVRRILVDDALFSGPSVSPAWAPGDVPTDYGAAITAVTVDGGRATPTASVRSSAPDLAAGHELATALGQPDLPVARGTANGPTVAGVQSPPLSELIAQMLQPSDNVIAETLGRLVAVSTHRAASFTGAAAAIRAVLSGEGVQVGGGMLDASGLAAGDRVTPAALAAVLRLITSGRSPSLREILGALPVAGWSGTLADRYTTGTARAGAGVVRAKTGTLTSVSTLAGTVHDRDGRLLIFVLMADRVGPSTAATTAAESALDVVAAELSGCGCG